MQSSLTDRHRPWESKKHANRNSAAADTETNQSSGRRRYVFIQTDDLFPYELSVLLDKNPFMDKPAIFCCWFIRTTCPVTKTKWSVLSRFLNTGDKKSRYLAFFQI